MRFLLKKCFTCNLYTLKDTCNKCKEKTHTPHPAKFSPDDKYTRYRVADRYKENEAKSQEIN